MALRDEKCAPCNRRTPPLKKEEVDRLIAELGGGWSLNAAGHLEREFGPFADFAGALAFANAAGRIAESEGHHPDLHVGWGRCRVEIWTHAYSALSKNDFVLAAKIAEEGRMADSYASVLEAARSLEPEPGKAEREVLKMLSRLILLDDTDGSDLGSAERKRAVENLIEVCEALEGRAKGEPGDTPERAEQQLGQMVGILKFMRCGAKVYDRKAQERALEDIRAGRVVSLDELRRRWSQGKAGGS